MSPIKIDPEIMGGTPCFSGTRVPVRFLFSSLKNNHSIEYFLEGYPSVSREQIIAVLELANDRVVQDKTSASVA